MNTQRLPTVVIENVVPTVNGGRQALKRVVGDELLVEADIFKDGHDVMAAVLKWRQVSDKTWREAPMELLINDRWRGSCRLLENGPHEFTIEAWQETWESWRHEWHKKFEAGQRDLGTEIIEGALLLEGAAARAKKNKADTADSGRLLELAAKFRAGDADAVNALADDPEVRVWMEVYADRGAATQLEPAVPVWVDRPAARFAAWYEFFPRSAEGKPEHEGTSTFRTCLGRVDDAKAMGFDVIYFPPIHPIGATKRKGKNNSVTSQPGEPGSPYAIGSAAGGHKAVEPSLGTLKDFDWLVKQIRERGMEVALDFAINCSPDHPYVKEHPEWFFHRPDGTIKFAENPPKRYEDIYPLNFHNENWKALWEEMKSIILFWCEHGVRIFRVDNPHTKPVSFWEWLISGVQAKFPDAIFLSEAFTKPKMMKALAKAGFTQSYSYFTWRTAKWEIEEYFTELTQTEVADYMRANLFPNTPDILPFHLQTGGRPMFMIRAVLATTLSSVYGIYAGFELCENAALPGREEYFDSEKYQFKSRDWNAPGNIKELLTKLNRARQENRALQLYDNLRFHPTTNEAIIFYSKMTPARDSVILVVVNLDPHNVQSGFVEAPVDEFALPPGVADSGYFVEDLLTGERYRWQGRRNYVSLDPHARPAHVLRLER
ncbi:MAG: alpha-1,4-glucan--maltose-1-phosphate maltosyltransferase [Verrucomicrobia bacterium]|nr:alpha-1,4-glucan--maltose-1-phosphate maltosyltransferase [Verrucomicrobiota bacterium]